MEHRTPTGPSSWLQHRRRVHASALRALTPEGDLDDVTRVRRSVAVKQSFVAIFDVLLAQEHRALFDEAMSAEFGEPADHARAESVARKYEAIQRLNAGTLRALTPEGTRTDAMNTRRSALLSRRFTRAFDRLLTQERPDLLEDTEVDAPRRPTSPGAYEAALDDGVVSVGGTIDLFADWGEPPGGGVAEVIAQVLHRSTPAPHATPRRPPTRGDAVMDWLEEHTRRCIAERDYGPFISYTIGLIEENRHVYKRADQISLLTKGLESQLVHFSIDPEAGWDAATTLKDTSDLRRFVRWLTQNHEDDATLYAHLDALVARISANEDIDTLTCVAIGLEVYHFGFPSQSLRLLRHAQSRVDAENET
jgi:hypothetical protein